MRKLRSLTSSIRELCLLSKAVLKKGFHTWIARSWRRGFFRVVISTEGMFRTEQLLTKLGYAEEKSRDLYFAEKHRASGPFLKDHAYRRIALYFGYHNAGYPRTSGEWKRNVKRTIHEAIKFYQIESLREFIGFDFAMKPELGLSNAVATNGETSPRGKLVQAVTVPVEGVDSYDDAESEPIEVQVVDEENSARDVASLHRHVTEVPSEASEVPSETLQASPKAEKKQSAKEAIFVARMTEISQNLKLLPGLKSLLVDTQKLIPIAEWNIQAEAKTALGTLKQITELLEGVK